MRRHVLVVVLLAILVSTMGCGGGSPTNASTDRRTQDQKNSQAAQDMMNQSLKSEPK